MIQERDNYCLCSVLSDIFLDYNIKITQDEIAKNLTPALNGFRADDNHIKEFLRNKGFNYDFYWWDQIPFNEPDSLLIDIANNRGFIGIKSHVYKVLKFEDPKITILDPANISESPKDFNYSYIMNRLRNIGGGFGLVKHID